MQRREYAHASENAGRDIGNRCSHLYGRMSWAFPGYAHQTAHALGHQVESAAVGIGSGAAEPGDRTVDQPRIQRMHCIIAEAHLLHGAAAEILDQHVRIFQQTRENVAARFRPEVQGNAALVSVHDQEGRGFIGDGWRHHAPRVVAVRYSLHLNDVSPHIGQQHRAGGSRHDVRKIDHFKTLQRADVSVSSGLIH